MLECTQQDLVLNITQVVQSFTRKKRSNMTAKVGKK